jgi:hypothetical protein
VGRRRRKTSAVSVVLFSFVSAVFVAGGFAPVSTSAAVGSRTLTVTPPTGLVDQVVQVQWTGFNPTVSVTLYQCKAAPVSLADCYTTIRPPAGGDPNGSAVGDAVTKADGTGSAFLEIRPALDLPVLDCSASHPCSVLAFENDGHPIPPNGLPATAVGAPLQFAPSPTDCPRVSTPDVTTLGEESAAGALYSWSAMVCNGTKALALDYTAKGSPEGRRNFLAGNVDVGLTSTPAGADEKKLAARDFAYAPIDLTGVAVAFNVTDAVTAQKITDMNLTPRLVAILLAGSQFGGPGKALFQDAEFKALNPGHNWPINTQPPMLRAERNADTYVLTNWLQQDKAARDFLDGKDPTAAVDTFWKGIAYPTDLFESRDPNVQGVYNPRTGTIINARRLFNFQPPGDGVTISASTDGLFGVMDAVTAHSFGLPTAKLRPANAAANTAFVGPDAAGITAGYAAMKPNADGVTKQADPTSATGYPLVKVDYAMVPTTGIADPVKRAHIAQFLDFAAGAGQQAGALPGGYVPMPPDLQAQVVKARDAVVAQTGVFITIVITPVPGTGPAPDAGLLTAPGDAGSFNAGGANTGSTTGGYGGNTGTAAAAPGAPVRSTSRASASRSPSTVNPVSAGLRDFLGGDHQLFLPVLFVLGAVALVAGPLLTLRSQGKLRRRKPASVGTVMS